MNERRHHLASLLHVAVKETDVRTVESLLHRGAEPNLLLDEGLAAVHLAAGKESEKGLRCLKVLLQHGADPNLRSGEHLTPLHIAALWGCYQNLKLLLKNGGDPNLRDQGGNKAVDLAEQEENSKCASILQEYESHTSNPEYDDLPKFHYSLYSDHSMRDCSVNLSLMSDLGDEPLSSTRYSSFYRKSESNRLRRDRDPHKSWLSDVSGLNARDSDVFNRVEAVSSLPPVLSSTRLSGTDLKKSPEVAQPDRFLSPSRKSVTFRDYDEYYPNVKHSDDDSRDSTVDFSLYPDFLHSDRVTTVLQNQGIDVTSPDEVFVFCREQNLTEDFDKTVVGGAVVGEEDEDNESHAAVSSNSGSSRYSSCDSEPYKTTIEAPLPSENISADKEGWTKGSTVSDCEKKKELNLPSQACNDEITEISFTPSPFVTGRTRSRLSRCSQRHSASSFSTSSLFEQTLPAPTRVRRDVAQSDKPRLRRPSEEDGAADLDSYLANLCVSSQLPASQASTLIISGSMADTIIIPRGATDESLERGSSSSSCCQEEDVFTEDKEFLTSDLSTSSTKIHKNTDSQDSSSESSSSFSQMLEVPSTGCTPRYSMSRICNRSQTQSLANLSYTPGGRPLITDTDEPVEYLYTDAEEGHELIETHVPPTSNTSLSSSVSEETVIYDWRSLQTAAKSPEKGKENRFPNEVMEREHISETEGLTDRELRRKLVELGEEPGPINRDTRHVYMRKLRTLQEKNVPLKSVQDEPVTITGYSPELKKVLCLFHLPDCNADEFALCEQFDQPDQNKCWREGLIKSSFNYLLLDPRVTKNLPYRSQALTPHECFQTFISSIFYVGKGKRSRPYSHLYEALEYFKGDKSSKKLSSKVQHILQVWNCGHGVISLHCFQNVIPVEAYTREACMVDAIGLKMLTNQKRGDYYGMVSTWPAKRQRELGVHLLYRAMQIFLAEGERQLRPADIRR
ncbi:ankyrin repeat and LEM domain-containing protein 1 isoform X2 [Tachysurus vachellii]|uniref:ankyrin repeat and LEM domain-containing protein 1 isoform X2 n=1 Tax=Tachysurus vachellii TaxID=175792 RepID=UPI00296A9EBB|nr:ankyrin repeat and LEM domain-containing protein 1 isoform X2 [Tachysurus vachellii]